MHCSPLFHFNLHHVAHLLLYYILRYLRHHHYRRRRVDPRCIRGRDPGWHDRHTRPCVPARPPAPDDDLTRRRHCRPRAVLDDDLSGDGDRAGGAATGPVPGGQ